jgi:hypothetical protein
LRRRADSKITTWAAPSTDTRTPSSGERAKITTRKGGQGAVEQRGDGAGGQDLADRGVAAQAHHQVAGRSFQEERVRQVHQVLEEIQRHVDIKAAAQPE